MYFAAESKYVAYYGCVCSNIAYINAAPH